MMCTLRAVFFVFLVLSGFDGTFGHEGINRHSAHRTGQQKSPRKHRAAPDGVLRFEPEPYSKNLELNTSGKIHCKVAGGVAPTIQWFTNTSDPLPDGVSAANGTLLVVSAEKRHAGRYTCVATDGGASIKTEIHLGVVVSPKVLEPLPGTEVHVSEKQAVVLDCRAAGDPAPTTQWDRNITAVHLLQDVDVEGGVNASTARLILLRNGSLWIRSARSSDSDRYGCTAGSPAGLSRSELLLTVHPEGSLEAEAGGGAARAVLVAAAVALAYMLLVAALMLYCRTRRRQRRQRGEKMELEMAEGREKLVEEGDGKRRANGAANGKLPHDRDSAEASEASSASRRGLDHLAAPRSLLTDHITLGRGEFGEVSLARVDISELKKLRGGAGAAPRPRAVLVKALSTTDESACAEFRRQLELFSRARHDNVARLLALCADAAPHLMVLEHTDWGDLKSFLTATRSPEQARQHSGRPAPLSPQHAALLAAQLAAGAAALAAQRLTHRDIAARNCTVSAQLRLKLSLAALSRGPDAAHYYKLHDQVIPLRWLPAEALEGEYSAKSDAYMFAATVWEIYTKAELPFAKLSDSTVLERLKAGTLEWAVPDSVPAALSDLLERCWSVSPAARPQFEDVCSEVNAVLQQVTSDTEAARENDP